MARSKITNRGVDLTKDNGAILQSLVAGEQLRSEITLKWITSLNGFSIAARFIEADNSDLDYSDGVPIEYPTAAKTGATVQFLPIRYISAKTQDSDSDDVYTVSTSSAPTVISTTQTINSFEIVWEDTIVDDFAPRPLPDQPVYGYFSLEVRDTGTGATQQIYKPMRGLVEFRYSVDQSFFV